MGGVEEARMVLMLRGLDGIAELACDGGNFVIAWGPILLQFWVFSWFSPSSLEGLLIRGDLGTL